MKEHSTQNKRVRETTKVAHGRRHPLAFLAILRSMIPLVLKFVVAVLAVFVAGYIVPGVTVETLYAGAIVAILLGLLNLIVRPILLLLTLPITLLTFGLFAFVINALLFWFVASFIEGFAVSGFLAAFLGALIVSAINSVTERFL